MFPDCRRLHRRGAQSAEFRWDRAGVLRRDRWSHTRCASPTSIRSSSTSLFERFLNPERVSMPDIDVDFCFERRGEVIEPLRATLRSRLGGPDHHAFGTMKARAAVKDVARVLKVPPGEADKLTKLIPSNPGFALTIPEAIKKVDELRTVVREERTLWPRSSEYASRIEGLSRHASVHAAGIVIAPGLLADYVPVYAWPTGGSERRARGRGHHHLSVRHARACAQGGSEFPQDGLSRPAHSHRHP